MPIRIQRKRTKGWKMPENTIYVGRPAYLANPYRVGRDGTAAECVEKYRHWLQSLVDARVAGTIAREELRLIRGKNLACWCPLDAPCHADVLLELANTPHATKEGRDQ